MNTANLQLEGLLLAVAAVNDALVTKGILTRDELEAALRRAERTILTDARMDDDISPSNREAVVFPIRVLHLAASRDATLTFSQLARMVGETKPERDRS
jgi:hypothetical protein